MPRIGHASGFTEISHALGAERFWPDACRVWLCLIFWKVTMSKKHQGFTLIELMIVVAIIGIIAAIAIPSYQSHVMKSQVNRAFGELAAYKSAVEERLAHGATIDNSDIGYLPSSLTTGAPGVDIAVLNPDGSGHIQVTMGGNAHGDLAGVVIRMERSVAGNWQCVIDPSGAANWKGRYSPNGCAVI